MGVVGVACGCPCDARAGRGPGVRRRDARRGRRRGRAAANRDCRVRKQGLRQQPRPDGQAVRCDHPAGDAAGVAVKACRSGMFQSYRNDLGFRVPASAPEYSWMVTGTDSNVRDRSFPSRLNPQQPEGGIVGCTPGHNDTSGPVYDLFGYMEATGVPFDAYQEDYPGGPTDCSTLQYSDGAAADPMFYARKHSPLLLTWSQAPDALVVNDGPGGAEDFSPPAAPTPAACKEHVRDFPGNVPNATTQAQRNFTGNEQFGRVTFVVPSMCHSGHDSNRVCLGSDTDGRGGIEEIDRWLELNLDGLRRDVGRNAPTIRGRPPRPVRTAWPRHAPAGCRRRDALIPSAGRSGEAARSAAVSSVAG